MIVVDASVINKIFLPHEIGFEKAQSIIENHILKKETILVPDLLYYEVANTLSTKSQIPLELISLSLDKLYKLNLECIHINREQIKKASKLAKKRNISVYDASYTILAEENKCNLVTADAKFTKQLNLPFIKLLK